MSFTSRIEDILRNLEMSIEKKEDNLVIAKSSSGEKIVIRMGNEKNFKLDEAENISKIIVISPHVIPKINLNLIKEALKSENKIIFLNKKSLSKIYPEDLIRVVNYLKENPNSYIKKISSDLNIHPEKVRRILLKLGNHIEIKSFQNKHLPKLPKIVSLRKEISLDEIKKIANNKIEFFPKEKKIEKIKYKKISKDDALPLVIKFIEENPGTHLREISRKLRINPGIVHLCLKEVSEFIEIITPKEIYNLDLPNLPNQLKLKDGYNSEGILRVIKVKKVLNIQ